MRSPVVSIVICTFNRCESLRRTLQSFLKLEIPPGLHWEVLIVDNNSTDATPKVSAEFTGQLPLRYIFEPRQGKSHALNRCLRETTAALLIFTDDDVEADHRWLANLLESANRHPEATFFGGRVVPCWERPPPRWVTEHSAHLLTNVVVCFDHGDSEKEIPWALGANLAIRRSAFDAGLQFRTDLGPPIRSEETTLLAELGKQGHKGIYVPNALIHHCNSNERATERYVRHWFKGAGMAEVRLGHVSAGNRLWFGAPPFAWKNLVVNTFLYAVTRFTCPSHVWLNAERNMAGNWGRIVEFRAKKRLRLGVYTPRVQDGAVVVKGGASRYLSELLGKLPKERFDIVFFAEEGPPTPPSETPRPQTSRPSPIRLAIGLLRETWELRTRIKAARIDVFHSNYAGFEFAPIAARLAGVKNVVAIYHCLPSEGYTTAPWLQRMFEAWSARSAHVCVAVSGQTKTEWEQRCPALRGRMQLIPYGIDAGKVRQNATPPVTRSELDLPANAPVLAVVARLAPMKGIAHLLDAMPAILEKHPDTRLLLIGDGPERAALEAKANEHVHFLGWRNDALRIVPVADIVVLPSVFLETWGFALAEAMALGKPCVATDVGGMQELVADGETGFIVPRRNPQALAEAIGRLLDDPAMAKRFGEAGKKRVEEVFQLDRMVEQTVRVYES